MHGDARFLQLGHERILALEDVGHLVVEALAVSMADHVDQQLFGAAETRALDEDEHSAPPTRRSGAGVGPRLEMWISSVHVFSPSAAPTGEYAMTERAEHGFLASDVNLCRSESDVGVSQFAIRRPGSHDRVRSEYFGGRERTPGYP